jgi:hypothetical protein
LAGSPALAGELVQGLLQRDLIDGAVLPQGRLQELRLCLVGLGVELLTLVDAGHG